MINVLYKKPLKITRKLQESKGNLEKLFQLNTDEEINTVNNIQTESKRYKRLITFENSEGKFCPYKKRRRMQIIKKNRKIKSIYGPRYENEIDNEVNKDYNDDIYILKPSDYPKTYSIKSKSNNRKCGRNSEGVSEKIVGGTRVALGEYPWMALIQYIGTKGVTNGCGGTLINSKYVLTAAHCVDEDILQFQSLQLYRIILGEYDTKTDPDCTAGPNSVCADAIKVYNAAQIIKHYNFDKTNGLLNDIALIKLDREVEFSDYIKPICLPRTNFVLNQNGRETVTVAGWGTIFTKKDVSAKESTSRMLNKVDLPVVDQVYCTNQGVILTPGQLCVGLGKGMDSCRGDSGGPAMVQIVEDSEIVSYQIGIISYGFSPDRELCGSVSSVKTFVPYYLNWIYNQM
ncbi:CLIP domain-containing serine protease HP8-like [Diorhabda sublineata]|uniref:CLIP domain-containing serine protease HP8-like n=1 Tax=Diorhabda sublineata TaxID=1163346 RepID=UPI0024E153FF|nr:CLIP domain-containing serine protease HP8-like [Diorhabda sublineata]